MPMSGANTICKAGSSRNADEAGEALKRAVPASVLMRFTQRGNVFYCDSKIAFCDFGDWLRIEASGIDIIRSGIEIAKARCWVVDVTGAEDFRRQAWREAQGCSVELRGYDPTDIERAEIAAVIERHGASYKVDPAAGRPDRRDRITGTVVAFGNDGRSEYITLRRDDGREVTRWGLDIARARNEAEGEGGRTLPIGEGERVTFADLGVRTYRSDGKVDLRKIVVIERVGIDFERRLAETAARFAPAKLGPGARVVDTRHRREHAPDQAAVGPPKGFDSTVPATYGSVIAGQSVTLYQPADGPHPVAGSIWWTSDQTLAARYGGKVHSATIRGEQIHEHATPFGSPSGPEFLFPNKSPVEIEAAGMAALVRRQGVAQTLSDIALAKGVHLAGLFAAQHYGDDHPWFAGLIRQTLVDMQRRGEPIPAPREKP